MMIDSMFGILILLLLATSFVLAKTPIIPMKKEKMDEVIAGANQKRGAFAREHRIANMHELTWNQQLADKVAVDEANGNTEDSADMSYVFLPADDILYDIDKIIDKIRNDLHRGSRKHYWATLHFLAPVHREVGCADQVVPGSGKYTHCYMAPGELFGLSEPEKHAWTGLQEILKVNGLPGSECHEGYGKNDLLCSILPPTTPAPITPAPTPKEGVNSDESSGSPSHLSSYSILVSILLVPLIY